MYVDEPTTGLDSSHAYDMMRMLKSYTEKERKTVVITIHQPSSQIFHMFDKILLLSEGQVAYFGERNKIISYFSNLGLQCAPHYNPADFVLQVVASSSEVHAKVTSAYIALKEVTDEFEMMSAIESLEQVEETESVIDMLDFGETLHYKHDMAHRPPSKTYRKKKQLNSVKKWYTNYYDEKWPTSFWTQYKVLTLRNFLQAKDKILSKWSAVQVLSVAMMVGLVWYQLDRKEETLKDREGVLFFTIIYWMFNSMMGSLTTFPEEREVLNKERSAGAYRLSAYYLAKLTSEFPLAVTLPTIYLVMVFPMVGLNGIIGFAGMWCGLMANALAAEAFGLCAGAYFLDQTQGITVCVTISLFYLMMGGFYAKHVPIWLSWGRYLSPPYYAFNAFIIVEFTRAAGFTCGEHNSIFEECSVDNVTTITAERVLEVTHDTVPYAYDTIFLVGYMLTFYVLGYLVLRYLRNPEKLFIMKKKT
ncbi:PREDICTED: ABC transporter G family member 21-like [Priapulus caudatus]|uniref:ABC transporter G family member 21-like n=1 Tax=Priapulus caudatus TaxID=37621 RepID=A0ABM1E592_PRICU|nr:PREDICTED: ABC transporter G family member 21-like [Priapulus caudatus]